MRRAVLAFALAQATAAHAESSVVVTLNPQGQQLANDLGISIPELIQIAQERIDELYKLTRIDELLRAFGNTAAFAQRGLGVDYDVDPGDILIGGGVAGVHGDVAIGTTNALLGGSIINFGVLAGVNLGRWHQPRWTTFANGFYEATTIHGLTGHLLTLGSHVQYHVLPASHRSKVRWTGLAATTGIEYARWTVGTATGGSIESHFIAEGTIERASIHMSSTGTLDVTVSTVSVPLEITTGVRLVDLFTFYAGGGLALTTGSSTVVAQLDSVLSINRDMLPVGDAVITGSGSGTPSAATVHALVGFEVHTPHARVFLQGAFAPGETAVNLGLRIAL